MTTKKVGVDSIQFFTPLTGTHKDYTAFHAKWLDPVSDTISSAEFSTTSSGLAFTSTSFTASTHIGWISPSAGNANTSYLFASKIFTAAGRIEKLPFWVKVGA